MNKWFDYKLRILSRVDLPKTTIVFCLFVFSHSSVFMLKDFGIYTQVIDKKTLGIFLNHSVQILVRKEFSLVLNNESQCTLFFSIHLGSLQKRKKRVFIPEDK